ncbi:MAG: MFS transporter [Firmicutes bacterium]|nr:MFS transporter [Bacillota bacterium]
MRAGTKIVLAALSSVPFILVLSNSMLMPVLPTMQKAMRISPFQAGLIITFFSVPAGILVPFAGILSDRVGRKKVMVPSMVVFGLGGLAAALVASWASDPYVLILAGRFVQGVGAAGMMQLAMALAGDIFQTGERTKALGVLEGANGVGKVTSPIIGSLTAVVLWYAPFFVYAVLAIPAAVFVWLGVKEPRVARATKGVGSYLQEIGSLFLKKWKGLTTSLLAGFLDLFLLFGVLFFLAEILDRRFEVSALVRGLVLAVPVLAISVTSVISGTYLQKKGFSKLIPTGLLVVAGALLFLPQVGRPVVFFAAVASMGVGIGLSLSSLNTLITSSVAEEQRGIITCIYGGVRFLGAAVGPPAFGGLIKLGFVPLFWGSAAMAGVVALAGFFFIDEKRLAPKIAGKAGSAEDSEEQGGDAGGHKRPGGDAVEEGDP